MVHVLPAMREETATRTGEMKHDWKRDYHMFNHERVCRNCGARQRYECISHDRLSGSRYGWKPNAGRCKPAKVKTNPQKETKT